MNRTELYQRPSRSVREFQGNDECSSSSESNSLAENYNEDNLRSNSQQNMVARPDHATNLTAKHVLFLAMLDLMCNAYQPDPHKARKLFQLVSQHLRQMNLMDGLRSVDELCSIRSQYKKIFHKLIQGCVTHMQEDMRPQTRFDRLQLMIQPRLHFGNPIIIQPEFHTSRFKEEFLEENSLGKGGYGKVLKAKHKVDEQFYAVKIITFAGSTDESYMVLREVKYLASLNHKNIVRYFSAWLEQNFEDVIFDASGNLEIVNTAPRAIGYQAIPAKLNHNDDYYEESGDSVVFENTAGRKPVSQNESMQGEESYSNNHTLQKQNVSVYIQMELCDSTLSEWLSERNYEGSKAVVDKEVNNKILLQILKAIKYIHAENIIHRDLKPPNIFICYYKNTDAEAKAVDFQVKVGDFGLSRNLGSSSPGTSTAQPLSPYPPLTPAPGMRHQEGDEYTSYTSGVGTAIYASPEQLSGSDYDQKSDMYSLGLIMYEMYKPFGTEMERRCCLDLLRKENLDSNFKLAWPTESKYIELLLNHDKKVRPSATELLETELFLSKDQIIKNLSEKILCKDEAMKRKDSEIAELRDHLRAKDQELYEKDLLIATLKAKLLDMSSQSTNS